MIHGKEKTFDFIGRIDMWYISAAWEYGFYFWYVSRYSLFLEIESELVHHYFFIIMGRRPFMLRVDKVIHHGFCKLLPLVSIIIVEMVKMLKITFLTLKPESSHMFCMDIGLYQSGKGAFH